MSANLEPDRALAAGVAGGECRDAGLQGPAMRARNLGESFRYAFAGLWYALRTQRNARIHFVAAAIVIGLGLALHLSTLELAIIVVVIAAVIATELMNTAIEAVVDLASPELHPLACVAKDVAAGAVLLTTIAAVVVGALIFGPHLLTLLRR